MLIAQKGLLPMCYSCGSLFFYSGPFHKSAMPHSVRLHGRQTVGHFYTVTAKPGPLQPRSKKHRSESSAVQYMPPL